MAGLFICLDGIDGAGKSTHLQFMRDWLNQQHIDAIFTREPGGTALGEEIRQLLLDKTFSPTAQTETLLMFAARAQHLAEIIRPALAQNQWVISDRFTDATYAYQAGGRGLSIEQIALLENWVQDTLRPDMSIILDISLETALARIEKSREKDRFELEEHHFFCRVREMYLHRAKDTARYAVINTDRPIEDVQKDIAQVLSGCLKRTKEANQ